MINHGKVIMLKFIILESLMYITLPSENEVEIYYTDSVRNMLKFFL